jgi:hypothetical protein
LRAARVALDESGEFAEADDLSIGEIGDVRPAGEREEMMLAEGLEFDVAEEDDLVVTFMEDGAEMEPGILIEAGEEFGIRPGDAVGGLEESLAVGVFTDGQKNLADGALEPGQIHAVGGDGRVDFVFMGAKAIGFGHWVSWAARATSGRDYSPKTPRGKRRRRGGAAEGG